MPFQARPSPNNTTQNLPTATRTKSLYLGASRVSIAVGSTAQGSQRPQWRRSAVAAGSVLSYNPADAATAVTAAETRVALLPLAKTARPRFQFQRGDIINIPHLVPSMDPNEKDPERRIPSKTVGFICPKQRFAVIVAIYETRLIVLPVYSCSGRGVSNKSDAYKCMAMSISSLNDTDEKVRALLTKEVLFTEPGKRWKAGAHINLNEMMSISYSWPISMGCGTLAEASKVLLKRRFQQVQAMAWESPQSQVNYLENKIRQERGGDQSAARTSTSRVVTDLSSVVRTNVSYSQMASKA